jgi:hypothetical protein
LGDLILKQGEEPLITLISQIDLKENTPKIRDVSFFRRISGKDSKILF